MSALAYTTPEALAEATGSSERAVRKLARRLGACRIIGNRMVLMPQDVVIILRAAKPTETTESIKQWLAADTADLEAEKAAQGGADPTGVVYFVQRANEVKIGFTIDIAKRLTNFRSASTEQFTVLLTIPAAPSLEDYFHQKFEAQRITREWFRLSGPIEEFIARRTWKIEP